MVVALSCLGLTPHLGPAPFAVIAGICALAGTGHLGWVTWRIASPGTPAAPHWSDLWCYGAVPLLLYLLLGATAVAAFQGARWASYAFAADTLALLLIGVRNAWDLVTWLAPGGPLPESRPPGEG
jgi:hypothetical protein